MHKDSYDDPTTAPPSPSRPHRSPADTAHGTDPWSVFTTQGWTVDITCIGGRYPEAQIPAPSQPQQLDGTGHPDHNCADRDCADYDIVCFVDGHAATCGSPRNPDLSQLMSQISEYGKVIAAVQPAAFNTLEHFSLRDP